MSPVQVRKRLATQPLSVEWVLKPLLPIFLKICSRDAFSCAYRRFFKIFILYHRALRNETKSLHFLGNRRPARTLHDSLKTSFFRTCVALIPCGQNIALKENTQVELINVDKYKGGGNPLGSLSIQRIHTRHLDRPSTFLWRRGKNLSLLSEIIKELVAFFSLWLFIILFLFFNT